MKTKSIYIAGPMTGYPELNFPAFHAAAARLREAGWEVHNPAEYGDQEADYGEAYLNGDTSQAMVNGFDFKEAYKWDVCKVIDADAIYMLRGWPASAGAMGELHVAYAIQRHFPEYEIIFEYEDEVVAESTESIPKAA